jgi:hypothetical protein
MKKIKQIIIITSILFIPCDYLISVNITKYNTMNLKSFLTFLLLAFVIVSSTAATTPSMFRPPAREFYQLIIYRVKDKSQEQRVDKYLSDAYLPALHKNGIKTVGVFKTFGIDTATNKKIYVFVTFKSLAEFHKTAQMVENDKDLAAKGSDYLDAKYDDAPYIRQESILMEAFAGMPTLKKPTFNVPKAERIYELRSYEGATEKLHLNKVQMFNKEEVEIFERIGSQPVFYAQVLSGSSMPNLMYMTTYSSMESRNEHWVTFGNDPKWKKVSALPEYQHNTSKAEVLYLVPTDYSDL